MTFNLTRSLVLLLTGAILSTTFPFAHADDPLVFISAFEPSSGAADPITPGKGGAIHAYQLDVKAGTLKLVQRTTDVEHPFFLALSPDKKFLYSIHAKTFGGPDHEQVAAYQVLGRSGQLKLLNRQSARGTAACSLSVDKTGKTVVVANYSSGSVAAFPVKEDGSLGEAASFIQHTGSSVDPARQKEPHAHCVVISPDNRFVFAADLGLDQVLGYKLDAATAKLTPHRQPFVRTPPGAGPRHLTFDPSGKHVYVINELKNSVTVFDYDIEAGLLIEKQTISTVPADFKGESYCADLKITPNGRFLYGTNRGHHSIAMYRIADDGKLTLIGIEPSLGDGPQNLLIPPSGDLLLCANMPGNNVALFRIDQESGRLKSTGKPTSIPSPSCIMLLP